MSVSGTSSTTSSTSSAAASLVVNGLISGISTQSVIQALLQSYEAPITNLQNEQATLNNQASDFKAVNSDMQAVLNAANALNTPNTWNLMTASSSNSSVATAVSSPGAAGGTLSFTVNGLAAGNLLLSSGGVSSTTASVTSASSALIATGADAIGFAGLSSSGVALGSHTISVTQASAAATVAGSTAPGTSTTITTGTNDTVALQVNGSTYNLTLAQGPYSAAGLVSALNSAAGSVEAPITASLNSAGEIQLSTNEQGSAATIQVTGGTALGTLGLTAGGTVTGANAVVNVDGTSTTLNAITAGGSVVLNAPSGTIGATIAAEAGASGSLVSTGTANGTEISTGSGSLADVVSAINAAGAGATATAVQQSNGSFRLQIAADNTGLEGAVTVDSNLISGGGLGTMSTVTQATDAAVNVGGANGYTLTSATNNFSNLLAGTTVTVAATGSATVTVSPDASGEATKVNTLVTAANQALADIQTVAGYNESTKTGGPLMGNAVMRNLSDQITSIFSAASGTSGLGDSANVGITLNSTGSLTFSQSTFESAFNANPSKVASLFTQDGSFVPAGGTPNATASLIFAGNGTVAGSYPVSISQSATQAIDTGAVLAGGTVSTPETLTVSQGGSQANYEVTAGESLSSIATGLNGVFASQGLEMSASVDPAGTSLQLQSNDFGSEATFSVSSTASGSGTTGLGGATVGTASTFTGTDVAGTINGVTATGTGQILTAPQSDPNLNGLSLQVAMPGIDSATNIGTFTFSPGLAQQLVTLANDASNAESGSLTTSATSLTNESTGLDQQITMYQGFASSQQTVLQNEFVKMETALGNVKNEGSELSSAISNLP